MRLEQDRKIYEGCLGRVMTNEEQTVFDTGYGMGYSHGILQAEKEMEQQIKALRQEVDRLELELGIC